MSKFSAEFKADILSIPFHKFVKTNFEVTPQKRLGETFTPSRQISKSEFVT
jgi:hypothetical protein